MKKILIIEDDVDTLYIISILLQDLGFAVISINREIPILEIEGINPDLIIIDYLLPYGMGDEKCLELKNNEATKDIPIIIYSASNLLESIAIECKADAFIAKPFDVEHLVRTVFELTDRN